MQESYGDCWGHKEIAFDAWTPNGFILKMAVDHLEEIMFNLAQKEPELLKLSSGSIGPKQCWKIDAY